MTVRFLLVLALVAACGAPQAAAPGPRVLLAKFERTPCDRGCRSYRLSIYRDGMIVFHGAAGTQSAQLTANQLDALDRAFAQAHYFDLAASYGRARDAGAVLITYLRAAQAKRVEDFLGDASAPPQLRALEGEIDRIIGIERWVGSR